jgi:hypothetical protein
LKNSSLDSDAQLRNYILRFLLFELSIDDEAYRRFSIKDNQLVMATDTRGPVAFLDVINLVYKAIKFDSRKEHVLLSTLKNYQTSLVTLLTEPDDTNYRFRLNDRHSEFMYPDVFLQAYAKDKRQIFNVLIDTINPLQSTENLFVSNIILMNYSFYILKNKPREILKLKKHVNDEALFIKLLEAIITRRMAINKSSFEKASIDQDLSSIKDNSTSFYNISYSL